VDLRRVSTIKDGEKAVGFEARAKIVKNRLAAPMIQVDFEILFASGVNIAIDLLKLGVETGAVTKRGARLSFGDVALGMNQNDAAHLLRRDAELAAQIRQAIIERRQPVTEGGDRE
jgi:recombination protein RecA